MKTISLLMLTLAILAGCAGIPTEYTSPCACDFKPLNETFKDDGKAVT
ncbi:MAG: hypothetical protein OXR62_03280 [Ahrensia sp.]|nr:hypothetical protein [Ahrensia sp.]